VLLGTIILFVLVECVVPTSQIRDASCGSEFHHHRTIHSREYPTRFSVMVVNQGLCAIILARRQREKISLPRQKRRKQLFKPPFQASFKYVLLTFFSSAHDHCDNIFALNF